MPEFLNYLTIGTSAVSAFLLFLNVVLYLTGRDYIKLNKCAVVIMLAIPYVNLVGCTAILLFLTLELLKLSAQNTRSYFIKRRKKND